MIRFFLSLLGLAVLLTIFPSECFAIHNDTKADPIIFSDAEKRWLEQHHTVTVRISREYPPFEFYQDGKFQGMAVDYLNEISERLDIEFEPAPDISWNEALNNIKHRQGVDMILLITHTHGREKFLEFTKDYISFPQVIFAAKHTPFISGINDLENKIVAVEKGYIMKSWLERDVPGVKFYEVNTSEDALRAVSVGEADVYVGDLGVGQYFIEKKGFINLKVAAPTSYDTDNMAMGIRKDWPELASLLDKTLASFTSEEQNAIKQRWLAMRYEYGIRFRDIVKWVLIVSVLSLVWIIHLKLVVSRRTALLKKEIEENRKANDTIRAGERKYQEIFNTTGEAIFVHDTQTGRILEVNRTMLEMFDCTYEEALKLSVSDLSSNKPPYTQQEAAEHINMAVHEGQHTFEWLSKRLNGDTFWSEVALRSTSIGGEGRVLAVVRDISDRKRIEQELRENEERLRQLSEATFEGIAITEKGIVIDANRQITDMLGYGHDELIGKSVSDFVAPESRELVAQQIKSGTNDAYEHIAIKKDGSRINVQARGRNARYKNREVRLTAIRDVTDQKKAEQNLRESEERFRNIFEHADVGIILVNLEGVFYRCNPAAAKIYKGMPGEIEGKRFAEFLHPEDLEAGTRDFRGLLSGEKDSYKAVRRFIDKQGGILRINITVSLLKDNEGRPLYALAVFEDISEQRKAEESLRESEEKFSKVFHTSPYGITISSLEDGRILDVNESFEKLSGYKREDAVGNTTVDLKFWTDVHCRDELISKLKTYGSVKRFEMVSQTRTGDKRNVIISAEVLEISGKKQLVTTIEDITDRKRAEAAILESKERYKKLFESANDGILIMKGDIFIDCNMRALDIYGCVRDQLIGHAPYEFSPPEQPDGIDSKEKAQELIRASIEGSQRSFEWLHKRYDGTLFYAEVSLNAIELVTGTHLQAIVRDITERKVIEEALKESEEKYRDLVETQTDFIVRWKPDTTRTFVNRAYCDYFGLTYDEAIGTSFMSLVEEKDREQLTARLRTFTPESPVSSGEHRIIKPDGSIGWNLWTDTAIFNDDGKLLEMQSIGRDITEKKEFEDALRVQAQIVDQIHDSVISTDLEGYITSWNKGAERLYGHKAEDVLGEHISIIYPRERLDFLKQQVIEQVMTKGFHETEDVCLRKGGRLVNTHLSLSIIRDAEGNPVGMIGYSHDITEKKVAERSAHLASIGELAAGVAHEINNPTNSIMLNAGLIKDFIDVSREKVLDIGNRIVRDSERISSIVTSLLSFSRVESLNKVDVDLVTLLDDVAPLVRDRLKKHTVQYTILDEPDIPRVKVNKQKIEQVLINLINNSIDALNAKYGNDARNKMLTVTIGSCANENGRYALMNIRDNGTGIPVSIIDRVRDPFFTTKPENMGTGLGLSISHGIIEDHGGEMKIESEEGQYTSVTILLPEGQRHE